MTDINLMGLKLRIYESKPIMFLISQKISADLKGPTALWTI